MASVLSHPAIALRHGFFDAMTNGGLGVAFFAPFDSRRYFLAFRPLEVAFGRGVRFANRRPRDSSQTGLPGPSSGVTLLARACAGADGRISFKPWPMPVSRRDVSG